MEDLHNYLLATPDSFRKLRYVPETVEREDEAPKKKSISGEDAFVKLVSLRSSRNFGDTRYRRIGAVKVI